MDNKPNTSIPTSFIPKQKISYNLGNRQESKGIISAIAMILITLSIIFLLLAVGYRYILAKSIDAPCQENGKCGLRASIEIEKKKLESLNLSQLKKLDTKIKLADSVLSKHMTLKPVFDLLSNFTIKNVQFKKMQFDSRGIVLDGLARRYEDVGAQSRALEEAKAQGLISAYTFSNFDLDTKGNVVFQLTLSVDPTLTKYRQSPQTANTSEALNDNNQ